MLITELCVGQSVFLDDVSLKLVRIDGNRVKLAIDAPKAVQVNYEKRTPRTNEEPVS
jgi:carbon storage regulator CsrA